MFATRGRLILALLVLLGPALAPAPAQVKARIVDAMMMKEMGLAWNLYYTDFGKAPAKGGDLDQYLEGGNTKKALANGDIVLVANAKAQAASVVAYEKEADKKGLRFVAFGDGSVKSLDDKEFKKALDGK